MEKSPILKSMLMLIIPAGFLIFSSAAPAPPAARLTDFHQKPLATPAGPVTIPHVGGPILMPNSPTVIIGGLPAAKVGDLAITTKAPTSKAIVESNQTSDPVFTPSKSSVQDQTLQDLGARTADYHEAPMRDTRAYDMSPEVSLQNEMPND